MAIRASQLAVQALLKRVTNERATQAGVLVGAPHDVLTLRATQAAIIVGAKHDVPGVHQRTTMAGMLVGAVDVDSHARTSGAGIMVGVVDPGPPPPSTDRIFVTQQALLSANTDGVGFRVTNLTMLVGLLITTVVPKYVSQQALLWSNIAVPVRRISQQVELVGVWDGAIDITQLNAQVARRRFKVLSGCVTTVAFMMTITRKDAVVKRFTSLDRDLTWEGDVYRSCNSFEPTSIDSSTDMSVDNLEMTGIIDSNDIDENDLAVGLYNNAKVELFIVDWLNTTSQRYILRTGNFGKITQKRDQFEAEIRGMLQRAQQQFGEQVSPTCRAKLGDARCTKDLTSFTFTGVAVTGVTNNRVFTASSLGQATDYFSYGLLKFTSGANENIEQEIKNFTSGGLVEMWEEFPYDVQPGDEFRIIAGCDKKLTTCKAKFNNVVNFRGEPNVPGKDSISQYPDSKYGV